MENINLHIYPSPFKYESRILKETKSISENIEDIDKIHIVAISDGADKLNEIIDKSRQVWRIPLISQKLPRNPVTKIVKLIEWMARIYIKYRKYPVKYINCHSLTVLPLSYLLKYKTGAKLIYDAHELETETAGSSKFRKKFTRRVEKHYINKTDALIVVSKSIEAWYQNQYNYKKTYLVRNIPQIPAHADKINLKKQLSLTQNDILFIYQGLLSKGRGLQLLLKVFSKISGNKHLLVLGYGPLQHEIKTAAITHSNIHFHDAVQPTKLSAYSRGADVGIALVEDVCLSYRYSLPNKFFEYLLAGIPVIASNFEDMSTIVKQYQCGWCIEPNESKLSALADSITHSQVNEKSLNTKSCQEDFSWQNESKILAKVFEDMKLV